MTSAAITTIRNPILPGFNPDPSICRVGEDYYIATSTFEWYPGVQIHHSRDLVNWRLMRRPLDRASQLDLRGRAGFRRRLGAAACRMPTENSGSSSPTSSGSTATFKDAHNYIVTAPAIDGPWSRSGLCEFKRLRSVALSRRRRPQMVPQHDLGPPRRRGRTGRKHPAFAGIRLQEWDPAAGKLVGAAKTIFRRQRAWPRRGPASL